MSERKIDLMRLRNFYPPMIGRTEVENFFPGILHQKSLANLESDGLGIPKYKFGKKVMYFTDDILRFIEGKIKK